MVRPMSLDGAVAELLPSLAFPRVAGELRCGAFSVSELAHRFGTPLYLYDGAEIDRRYLAVEGAFEATKPLIAYSVKANANLAVLHRLARLGAGADIVSLGELFRARKAGVPADRIVFAGVGKTRTEIEAGLDEGIYGFNVESEGELRLIDQLARDRGVRAPVALRVNPDVMSPTPHEYTRTGHAESKFGIPVQEALPLYRWASEREGLEVRGIDLHIGSQIVDLAPYRRAFDVALSVVDSLAEAGIHLDYLDLGGGYGLRYAGEAEFPLDELARLVHEPVERRGMKLVLEPGRFVVGEAGLMVTRVLYVKSAGDRRFVITDGGMTELLRPSHYGGYHAIEPVVERPGREGVVDVVGPVCETGDFLARGRRLTVPEPGDLLAVHTAGAYGFVMASNYNARRRPAEVLVDGERAFLARRRETLDDLIRGEEIPAFEDGPAGGGEPGASFTDGDPRDPSLATRTGG